MRSLQLKKNRDAENVYVVEGEKMVLEGLRTELSNLVSLFAEKDYSLPVAINEELLFNATSTQLDQISTLRTPNKLIAVFRRKVSVPNSDNWAIALDNVQDPGNMGTILRLADWFGIQEIICSENTVDCYNPKVVQSSMGAVFRIPVRYVKLSEWLKNDGRQIYGALLNGSNYAKTGYSESGILLMGNEGNGISEELIALIHKAVTIPRFGEAESLNVATATAILLAEIRRD